MTEVLVAQDPALRARAFLKKYFDPVEVQVPPKWPWTSLLIVLTDNGGPGEYSKVLSDCTLTVEVSHPKVKVASDTARQILGLLHEWPHLEEGVYWRREIGRPAFQPDDDTGVPSYIFTVSLAFRSDLVALPPR